MANLSEKISFIQEYIATIKTNHNADSVKIREIPNANQDAQLAKLHQDNLKLRQTIVKSEKIIANAITQIQDLAKNG